MHVVISKSLSKINHYLTTGHNNMIKYNYTNLGQSWMDDDDIEEWNDSNPWDRYESWESPNDLVFDDSGNSITRHQLKTKNYNSDVWGGITTVNGRLGKQLEDVLRLVEKVCKVILEKTAEVKSVKKPRLVLDGKIVEVLFTIKTLHHQT